jgi:prepilin-type N-terminal cleavage/methylation domain-containing protein
MRQSKQAFTILELMISVLIVGIIAAFALPDYRKSLDRTMEEDMIRQLQIIYTAENTYFSLHDQYLIAAGLDDINTGLGLDIIAPPGVIYSINVVGTGYQASVINNNANPPFAMLMDSNRPFRVIYGATGGNPYCNNPLFPCPTLGNL